MKVHHGREPWRLPLETADRDYNIYKCESTAYRRLSKTGACARGVTPEFYGTMENINPSLCLPHLEKFLKDEFPPTAIFLEYIPNMQELSYSNYTKERMQRFLDGMAAIHETKILHSDLYPRNMMIVEGNPERNIWIDFDRAQTLTGELSKLQKEYFEEEREVVKDIGHLIVKKDKMFDFLHRLYTGSIAPTKPAKQDDALRFGLLGATWIAPTALIAPAKTHPEVVIACVAARDRGRAEEYAKKHDIPVVHDSYEDVINDPSISCVYIALPNSHHYEWTLRAIKAGKHVLLEKPSTSNATEAKKLFEHPLVTAPNAPVILEAFHYMFHPAWQTFLHLIHDDDPLSGPVKSAYSQFYLHKGYFDRNDPHEIRFRYALGGGCTTDFASYPISHIRQMLGDSHPVVTSAKFRLLALATTPVDPQDAEQIDEAVTATYKSAATGAEARIVADFFTTGGWPILPASWSKNLPSLHWPKCVVELGEKQVNNSDEKLNSGETHVVQRTITLYNHIALHFYHSILIEDTHTIKRDDDNAETLQTWTTKKTVKAYDWPDKSDGRKGEAGWPTYRWQLEEFVNRVKGRKGSGVWFSRQDSIDQMAIIDEMYEKGGLKPRPSASAASEFDE